MTLTALSFSNTVYEKLILVADALACQRGD